MLLNVFDLKNVVQLEKTTCTARIYKPILQLTRAGVSVEPFSSKGVGIPACLFFGLYFVIFSHFKLLNYLRQCGKINWFIHVCALAPLSTIFQLYHGEQFMHCRKPEYSERTTDHGQVTGIMYHLRLGVECTYFGIYKTGHEPTPYW